MVGSSPNGQKTLWEKEKLLVTSNFSFSHNVFKRHVRQTRKNQGLFGKELRLNNFIQELWLFDAVVSILASTDHSSWTICKKEPFLVKELFVTLITFSDS